ITVSVGMVRVIICHQLNTKNNIISGSEVSRLSVAIHTVVIKDASFLDNDDEIKKIAKTLSMIEPNPGA
ncbi:hypothetical protein, partial [Escherichia coli]|uniref:hypothetical protein n=1 Tax=Escherichia coli TaxID=562 RepID=UPI003F54CECE